MKAKIQSKFSCTPEVAWEYVQKPELMRFIAKPLITFEALEQEFPNKWQEGQFKVRVKAFGFINLGTQTIVISIKVEDDKRIVRDNGYGNTGLVGFLTKWDHWIYITPGTSSDTTTYIDEIDVRAGVLTIPFWIFANIFYRWRQSRWKKLINNNFKQISNG